MRKFFKNLKNFFGKELEVKKSSWEEIKFPLYTLGSADPRCFKKAIHHCKPELNEKFHAAYNSFSGVDIRAIFDDETIGTLQGISFGFKEDGSVGGTCVFIIFDQMEHIKWLDKEVRLVVTAANEYGNICTVYNAKVRFDKHEQFGISIDDIVVEIRLDFTLVERYYTDYKKPEVPVCVS